MNGKYGIGKNGFGQPPIVRLPTSLSDVDKLLGGGFAPGRLVGLIGRPQIASDLSLLALQMAVSFARVARTAFITMAMDQEAVDAQLKMLGALGKGYGPGVGLEVVASRGVDIDEMADLAWSSDTLVIDGLHAALYEHVEGAPPYVFPPEEDEFDKLKTLTRTTGALVVATAPLRYHESFDALRSCHRECSVAYDLLMLVDMPVNEREAVLGGMPVEGTAQVRIVDVAGRVCPKVTLAHAAGLRFADCFDESRPQWVEACEESSFAVDCVLLRKDEGSWFERFVRTRIVSSGAHPFTRYADRAGLPVGFLLCCMLRQEAKMELHLPFCSPDARTVVTLLKHDYPELFYVNGVRSVASAEDGRVAVSVEYRMSRDEAVRRLSAMEDAAASIVDGLRELPVDARVAQVHDWLCANVAHVGVEPVELSGADAALLEGKATDAGITQAFHFLCDRAGIAAAATFGAKDGALRPWSTVWLQPGKPDYADRASQVCLNVDVAEDVKLSNASGKIAKDFFAVTDQELASRGYERPYALVNEYTEACTVPYPDESAAEGDFLSSLASAEMRDHFQDGIK